MAEADGLAQVVSDINGGGAGASDQAGELVEQEGAGLRVERAQRFVHQQAGGADGEGAGDADALAHATRELLRPGRGELGQAGQRQNLGHAGAAGAGWHAALEREGDVAGDGAPGQQGEVLEHGGDGVQAVGRDGAVHDDLAGGGLDEAADDAE